MVRTGWRPERAWRAAWPLAAALVLLLPLLPSPAAPAAQAHHGGIMLPFETGAEWFVSQGYNTSPAEGWSHFNCDPKTGKDGISQSSRCDDGWQYKYSFDLRRVDGDEAGQPVLSPATGVVRWIDPAYGGLSIDLGDGYAVAFFHTDLARGIAVGDELRAGQRVGHVSGPGGGGNGGTPHIHLTVWKTEDGGNWSRIAVPFEGDHPLEGQAFPALPERERNQHLNAVLASSNAPAAPAASPEAPLPVAPADGAVVERRQDLGAFVWEPVLDAAEYQVVLDGGARTGPWLARTRWDPGDLPEGGYTWQVKARNAAGESPLSAVSTLTVGGDDPAATPAATPEATPVDLAQAVGPTTLNLAAAQATVGTRLTTNGSGFAPGETVRLFWNGASGPLVAEATANDGGAFTVSVPIPAAPAGDHQVLAEGRVSRAEAEGWVEVIPSIAAEPAIAAPGDEVEVTLRGFGGDEPLNLSWSGEGGPTWGSGRTDANGSVTLKPTAPEAPAGLYDLLGVGVETGVRALGAFRLDGEGGAPPATAGEGRMRSPGTFSVTATVLGLIGGTTSSGEIIDAEDRLVALPACTNTSCPWLEPGAPDELFGTRIECGDRCFVRVVNPESGICAVAPVLETGPWFTLDDWWNPTAERALNRLPGATSRLAQGYPGAEAAQDGLDVGYGRSPDGVGISNKGYVVGNQAALDLSNRTWQDIGLDLAVGVAEVEATMLWLSGEDPEQAGRACADPLEGFQEATPPASSDLATPVAEDAGPDRDAVDRSEAAPAADGNRGEPERSNESDEPDEPGDATSSDERGQALRGYRSTQQGVVERGQQTTGEATTSGVGSEGGTETVGDAGASGQHDGPPLPPRLAAKLPGPGAASPSRAGTGLPPPASAAPNLEGLVTGAIPTLPPAEPATPRDEEGNRPRDGAPPNRSDATGGDPEPTAAETADPGDAADTDESADPDEAADTADTAETVDATETVDSADATDTAESADATETADAANAGAPGAMETPEAIPTEPSAPSDAKADGLPEPSDNPDAPAPNDPERSSDVERDGTGRDDRNDDRHGDDAKGGRNDRRDEAEVGGADRREDEVDGADRRKEDRRADNDAAATPDAGPTPVAVEATPAPVATPGPAPAPEPTEPVAIEEPVPAGPAPTESVEPPDPAPSPPAPTEPPPASTEPAVSPVPSDPTPIPAEPTPLPEAPPPAVPEETPVEETPAPTPTPDAPAPVETRVFLPASDASVWASDPARMQEPMQVSVLPVGGPDGAVAYVTFQVEGLAPGSLVSARLVLVGAIGFGGPLSVGALPGVWVDEAGLTSAIAPGGDSPAIDASGVAAAATPIWPGSEAVFDVSGTVSGDGAVTFVVRGTPDAGQALGSRESEIPARLEVEAGWAS